MARKKPTEIKDLVAAHLTNFYTRITFKAWNIIKKQVYFLFDFGWYSIPILILSVKNRWGGGGEVLNGQNLLSCKRDKSYLSIVPYYAKSYRTPTLNIARLDPNQDTYIVNRKLETKSTGRFSLSWLSYLNPDLRLRP